MVVGSALGLDTQQTMEVFKMTVNAKLSQLSKMWKSSQPTQPSYSNVEDGDYIAQLKEMKLEESKGTGRLQVASLFDIVDGQFEGKTVKRFDGLDNETSMGYFKGYCEVIGLELPDDLNELQDVMDTFVANNSDLFNITVKTSEGKNKEGKTVNYTNVYVNGISDVVLATEEDNSDNEQVEEQQIEEQQIQQPLKKFSKPATTNNTKPVAKPIAQPIKKVVVRR
jgi:hypothetical protein